ncbi:MAG: DoxX family protein [Pseudonocardia sp.]|nr:DoxX family protein [Pseudonocardia sp.]MBO0874629.1 DoxX family protein [Pseudonocardia sp.]
MSSPLPQRAGVVNFVSARLIAYWTFTLVIAGENLGGAIWAALRIDYSRAILSHLGYPLYVFDILGPGELLIAVALLLPGFPTARQWAYAGATAKYAAALVSWLSVGELHSQAGWAVLCLVLGLASWALRPRADAAPRIGEIRASRWLVTLALVVVLAIVTLLTLPAPPQF